MSFSLASERPPSLHVLTWNILCAHSCVSFYSYKDISPVELEPHPDGLNLNHLLKGPISKYCHTAGLQLQHMIFFRDTVQSMTVCNRQGDRSRPKRVVPALLFQRIYSSLYLACPVASCWPPALYHRLIDFVKITIPLLTFYAVFQLSPLELRTLFMGQVPVSF